MINYEIDSANVSTILFQILQLWHTKKILTVRDLIKKMVTWTDHSYLNKEVWENFSTKIKPTALPVNIPMLQLPAPPSGPHQEQQIIVVCKLIYAYHLHLMAQTYFSVSFF